MLLFIGAFLAGIITVFAPCVFALLPVIIGGSMTGNVQDKRRPLIIAGSLALSLIAFTLLLKVATVFINIPPSLITAISGVIIIVIGILMLFPVLYERIVLAFNLQIKSQQLLGQGAGKGALAGAVITGLALGPVFSSCSPVYSYILATVLPVNFAQAIVYMIAYVLGLSLVLLAVGYAGQRLVRRLSWASNPHGWFQRIVAILFIIVGLLVMTGYDKKFQTYISEHTPFNFDGLSAKLIPGQEQKQVSGVLNVEPYDAPEFNGISTWINSEPQTLGKLKGKVVLVDFWTYSCINCIRTQPYLKSWYKTYHDSGLEIVGVHAPEFSFEKNPDNVRAAVKKAGLTYPIAMDNDLATWAAYQNQYWPSSYLIDAKGKVRRVHYGEGEYDMTEEAIRKLLKESGRSLPSSTDMASTNGQAADITPETYLGARRATNYAGKEPLVLGDHAFSGGQDKSSNGWTLDGNWTVSSEGVTAGADASLTIRVTAKDVYLVTGSDSKGSVGVTLNGKPISDTNAAGQDVSSSKVSVSMAQLYRIVQFNRLNRDATIVLRVDPGVQLNTLTFGG